MSTNPEDAPKRRTRDGRMTVTRGAPNTGTIIVAVVDYSESAEPQAICMSDWQARRVLAALSLMLDLPLSAASRKAIEL